MPIHIDHNNADYGSRIATLEIQMKGLVGNGQPGKIAEMEKRLLSHERLLWIGMGVLMAMQLLNANGLLNIRALFKG